VKSGVISNRKLTGIARVNETALSHLKKPFVGEGQQESKVSKDTDETQFQVLQITILFFTACRLVTQLARMLLENRAKKGVIKSQSVIRVSLAQFYNRFVYDSS